MQVSYIHRIELVNVSPYLAPCWEIEMTSFRTKTEFMRFPTHWAVISFVYLIALSCAVVGRSSISYPADWPDSTISLPPGCRAHKYRVMSTLGEPTDGYTLNGGSLPGMKIYAVGFSYEPGWSKLTNYFDEKLLAAGYSKAQDEREYIVEYNRNDRVVGVHSDPKIRNSYMLVISEFK
jgi:hypothetical protein